MLSMWKRLISLFKKKKQDKLEEGVVRFHFRLPNGKEFYVEAIDPKHFKK